MSNVDSLFCEFKALLGRLCRDFKDGNNSQNENAAENVVDAFWSMLNSRFRMLSIGTGLRALRVHVLDESAQAVLYCYLNSFIEEPMQPYGGSYFHTRVGMSAYKKYAPELAERGLLTATKDSTSEYEYSTVRYLLSPRVCSALFKGQEVIEESSLVAGFGDLIRPEDIIPKDLLFPQEMSERLELIECAISKDSEVSIRLAESKMRSSLTFLFYGPPGCGKTEFVLQIARRFNRKVIKIDAAKLDGSLYGQQPKRIRAMFLAMQYINSLCEENPLFFLDECDALLGNRVTVQQAADRESNLATNTILDELNTFSGILVAATNHVKNLDPAMGRRFLMKVEFPLPDIETIAKIWKNKLPYLTDEQSMELAEEFPVSAGIVDNVLSMSLIIEAVKGEKPSFAEVVRLCRDQGGNEISKPIKKIGF